MPRRSYPRSTSRYSKAGQGIFGCPSTHLICVSAMINNTLDSYDRNVKCSYQLGHGGKHFNKDWRVSW